MHAHLCPVLSLFSLMLLDHSIANSVSCSGDPSDPSQLRQPDCMGQPGPPSDNGTDSDPGDPGMEGVSGRRRPTSIV